MNNEPQIIVAEGMLSSPQNELVLHFKTQPCTKSHSSSLNDSCHFYHSPEDRRRPLFGLSGVPLYMGILYLPDMVPETDREKFSFNLVEYNYHIDNFRTKNCPRLKLNSKCDLGDVCPYVHDDIPIQKCRKAAFDMARLEIKRTGFSYMENESEKSLIRLCNGEEAYIEGGKVDFKEDLNHAFIGLNGSAQIEKKIGRAHV